MQLIQRLKHILYRFKTKIFSQSKFAQFVYSKLWRTPSDKEVKVIYRKDTNILPYFDFEKLDDEKARTKLRDFTARYAKESDIVYEITGDILIEPGYGLGILKNRKFIVQTKSLSHPFLRPSFSKYFIQKNFKRQYTEYDALIHCDGYAGTNLCHFIYDTINPMLFLARNNIVDLSLPVLISEKIYSKPFFQYCLQLPAFKDLKWVVQKNNEWVRTKKVYKPHVSMEIFPETYRLFAAEKKPYRKIFLNRKSFFQRNIKNIKRIEEILQGKGFEMIYAEDLSYEKQVELFREVKYFVGIHGAGLTNLLHSKIDELYVLEIFSESLVHASFYRFLEMLHIKYYDAIVGSAFDINWNFTIDENKFRERVELMLSAGEA